MENDDQQETKNVFFSFLPLTIWLSLRCQRGFSTQNFKFRAIDLGKKLINP